jgi:hypothetical protein
MLFLIKLSVLYVVSNKTHQKTLELNTLEKLNKYIKNQRHFIVVLIFTSIPSASTFICHKYP